MKPLFESKKGVTPLDYSKVENWIINANADLNTDFDLIFFCGTSVIEADDESGIGMDAEMMRAVGYENFMICGSMLTENARVFCPIQRQVALRYAIETQYTHNAIFENISSKEPYIDLEAALDYYFEHYNKDAQRPFVLAGHSQGAAALQVAIGKYFMCTEKKEYLKKMIAAYSIGYGVSKQAFEEMTAGDDTIHFAEGAGDFNCLISWNVEGTGEKGKNFLLADEGEETLVINPLNWKRDETYASINENEGVLVSEETADGKKKYHVSIRQEDLADAQIDLKRGSVTCSTNKDYVNLPFAEGELWGGKSLHCYDGRAYYNNVKSNLRLRVKNYLEANK